MQVQQVGQGSPSTGCPCRAIRSMVSKSPGLQRNARWGGSASRYSRCSLVGFPPSRFSSAQITRWSSGIPGGSGSRLVMVRSGYPRVRGSPTHFGFPPRVVTCFRESDIWRTRQFRSSKVWMTVFWNCRSLMRFTISGPSCRSGGHYWHDDVDVLLVFVDPEDSGRAVVAGFHADLVLADYAEQLAHVLVVEGDVSDLAGEVVEFHD